MRFLIFGDIVGKIGRRALKKELPSLQSDLSPDFTIVQAENLAHGKGITEKTINEMRDINIDCFTGGNHTFSKPNRIQLLDNPDIIRPENYPKETPGAGHRVFTVGKNRIIVLNLQAEVFMRDSVESPFTVVDSILNSPKYSDIKIRLIDFHGEVTSERVAMGWYVDGRASLIWGTHTHVQTNDSRILPKGTGYITDIGMAGDRNGVIGVKKEIIVNNFINPENHIPHDFTEEGPAIISGIIADIDEKTGKCTNIDTLNLTTDI